MGSCSNMRKGHENVLLLHFPSFTPVLNQVWLRACNQSLPDPHPAYLINVPKVSQTPGEFTVSPFLNGTNDRFINRDSPWSAVRETYSADRQKAKTQSKCLYSKTNWYGIVQFELKSGGETPTLSLTPDFLSTKTSVVTTWISSVSSAEVVSVQRWNWEALMGWSGSCCLGGFVCCFPYSFSSIVSFCYYFPWLPRLQIK